MLYRASTLLGPATGFVWSTGARAFVVTNWHVLAGRNTYTGQANHSSGEVPDRVEFKVAVQNQSGIQWLDGSLTDLNEDGGSKWLQHPIKGQDVDIAAFEIAPAKNHGDFFAIERKDMELDIAVSVGSDIFIVGYPLGISKQFQIPIWKRGSIASEFSIPFDNLPVFVVDTATREGMSGSPVYARSWGSHMTSSGDLTIAPGIQDKFLGVYSGRYGANDELSAQLGRVWHASLINELIDGNARGTYQIRTS
jgi:Trypsin-like peptidase domain